MRTGGAGVAAGGEQAAWAVVQLVVLAALGATVGLATLGWLAGLGYTLAVWALLTWARRRTRTRSLRPADRVTLTRTLLVGAVTALVVDRIGDDAPLALLVTLATVALLLDAVDGEVARRTGTATPLGARFDMEVDAFLILVLCVHLTASFGLWVLAIGTMRYFFVLASWVLPRLRAALPPSFARKAVAASQGIILVVATASVVPRPVATGSLVLALACLVWSFGRDTVWLWRGGSRPQG